MESNSPSASSRIAIDVGSTVVKVAQIGPDDDLIAQDFYPRDFKAGIAQQVHSLLDRFNVRNDDDVLICSSANGGLRVGIVSLTKHFSGATLRNQVLLAGANPVFVRDFDEGGGNPEFVDILLVGGGIDSQDAAPFEQRLREFTTEGFVFSSLFYAGNRYLADVFAQRFPKAVIVPNPLAENLVGRTTMVFEAVRRAYLDDLVYKEGVSELRGTLSRRVRPTPEVVNQGFQRAVLKGSNLQVVGACLLIDIGGATTDLHYTVDVVHEDSENRPLAGSSVARYVFTDLGIVASRDNTLPQMRSHTRLYEFMSTVLNNDEVQDAYRTFREGEYIPSPQMLSYACLFLAFDRFAAGRGPGLPTADLNNLAELILTGGAAQSLDIGVIGRLVDLFLSKQASRPRIFIDSRYKIWVGGITWNGGPESPRV